MYKFCSYVHVMQKNQASCKLAVYFKIMWNILEMKKAVVIFVMILHTDFLYPCLAKADKMTTLSLQVMIIAKFPKFFLSILTFYYRIIKQSKIRALVIQIWIVIFCI